MNDLLALLAAILAAVGAGGPATPPGSSPSPDAAAPSAGSWGLKKLPITADFPVAVVSPPADASRLFVVEQRKGRVLEWNGTTTRTYLDVHRKLVVTRGEEGLLGIAFHPRFAANGRLFIVYTGKNATGGPHLVTVEEWRERGGQARFVRRVIGVQEYTGAHNGGNLAFGPDGFLYLTTGDGGAQQDPRRNGQNPDEILGKVLRLDVDRRPRGKGYGIPRSNPFARGGGAPEVWALGLRNPWRWSFDRQTGDIWIGDVGQNTMEEVSFLRRARTPRGAVGIPNFGWSRFEGVRRFQAHPQPVLGKLVKPVFTYLHGQPGDTGAEERGCSIVGGYVYRGTAIPALRGRYLAADFCSRYVWAWRPSAGRLTGKERFTFDTPNFVVSFGEDADGELYIVGSQRGAENDAIYKIVPAADADPGLIVPDAG